MQDTAGDDNFVSHTCHHSFHLLNQKVFWPLSTYFVLGHNDSQTDILTRFFFFNLKAEHLQEYTVINTSTVLLSQGVPTNS